jgi:hypothetical protein
MGDALVGAGSLAVILYLLPALIAFLRRHQNRYAIFFLNLFVGWTGIGWIISFVWSCTNQVQQITHLINTESSNKGTSLNELERLAKLKQDGVLTDDEFSAQKEKILNE